jgi:hypothetical protein
VDFYPIRVVAVGVGKRGAIGRHELADYQVANEREPCFQPF